MPLPVHGPASSQCLGACWAQLSACLAKTIEWTAVAKVSAGSPDHMRQCSRAFAVFLSRPRGLGLENLFSLRLLSPPKTKGRGLALEPACGFGKFEPLGCGVSYEWCVGWWVVLVKGRRGHGCPTSRWCRGTCSFHAGRALPAPGGRVT